MTIKAFFQKFLTPASWGRFAAAAILILLPFFYLKAKLAVPAALLWGGIFVLCVPRQKFRPACAAFILFLLYTLAEYITLGEIGSEALGSYMLVSVSALFVLTGIRQCARGWFKTAGSAISGLLVFLLAFPALFCLGYYVVFGAPVPPDAFFAIGQTNMNEAKDFLLDSVGMPWILVMVLVFASFIAFFLMPDRKAEQAPNFPVLVLFTGFVFCVMMFPGMKENLKLPNSLREYATQYNKELETFKDEQAKKSNHPVTASTNKKGETIVLVIGESLNKRHMGLYGYQRDTTPKLDALHREGKIIRFDNAFSSHTHTMQTLSVALTQADLDNGLEYYDSPTIIDVAKGAGFETWWVSNQALMGPWDNMVALIANSADHLVALNKNIGETARTHNFDGATVGELEKILSQVSDKNRFIVVHLIGNHGSYCDRFPDDFKKYDGKLPIGEFGKFSKEKKPVKSVNCYDNSVLYNDTVVADLIDAIDKVKGETALLYFSDHAEDIFELKGHNSGVFTYDMTHIPMVFWASSAYSSANPKIMAAVEKNAARLFSNDYMYDTMISVMGISTDAFNVKNSLATAAYTGDQRKNPILNGKRDYKDSEHQFYALQNTQAALEKAGQGGRVVTHRVNTTGKLADVLASGARDLEIDVMFDAKAKRFDVGHDAKVMTDKTLEDFLKRAPEGGFRKIWLDIKNMGPSNTEAMLAELQRLDTLYGLKKSAIVESGMSEDSFKIFADAGFHTSYYLPTNVIEDALKNKDTGKLNEMAVSIGDQAKRQNAGAVSFDISLYPFVKEYLQQKLSKDVIYHTWDTDRNIKDENFLADITKQPFYKDGRIKTILVSFPSRFSL